MTPWERYMFNPGSTQDIRQLYTAHVREAARFYLEDDAEADRVTEGTLEQAERVYQAAEREASVMQLLAHALADQCQRLLPRPTSELPRCLPSVADAFRFLSHRRFVAYVAEVDQKIAVLVADVAEETDSNKKTVAEQRLTTLQTVREVLMNSFYNSWLPGGNDDDDATGAIGVVPKFPPPVRGSGERRTREQALTSARNP